MDRLSPRVSVVVPAFNAELYIEACLASLLSQTERRLEVIVVDDCSTDTTCVKVETLMADEPRLRLTTTAKNGGPSAARNVGVDLARGEWIALLDADDTMRLDRLATLLDLADLHGAEMVADNILLVHQAGSVTPTPMIPRALLATEHRLGLAEFILRNVGTPEHPRVSYGFLKPLIRRDFLQRHAIRYDEHVRFAEDFALYVQCLQRGASWWLTPEPMYNYLVRARSLTEVQSAADLDRLRRRQRALLSQDEVRSDLQLTDAIRRHLKVIDRDYHYRAFTDAVKARRWGTAFGILFSSPQSVFMIVGEVRRQTPVILAKVVRGGYGRSSRDEIAL